MHDSFGLCRVLCIWVRSDECCQRAARSRGGRRVLGATLLRLRARLCGGIAGNARGQHHGFAELIFPSAFEGVQHVACLGHHDGAGILVERVGHGIFPPSATWMKSVSRPSEATSVSRSNDPEALRLSSVSASASALALSEMILDCISRCLSASSFSRSRHSASVARAASNAAPSSSAMESASLRNASSCCRASSRWEVSESRWEA